MLFVSLALPLLAGIVHVAAESADDVTFVQVPPPLAIKVAQLDTRSDAARRAAARSVISRMNAAKPTTAKVSTTTTKAVKPKPTKSTKKKSTTTVRKVAKSTTKAAAKPKKVAAKKPAAKKAVAKKPTAKKAVVKKPVAKNIKIKGRAPPPEDADVVASAPVDEGPAPAEPAPAAEPAAPAAEPAPATEPAPAAEPAPAPAPAFCAPQEVLSTYRAEPNTPLGFLIGKWVDDLAYSPANATGYTRSFTGQLATANAEGYMGYRQLATYDDQACAAFCDQEAACTSFNIYLERVPSLDPADTCANPEAAISVGCTMYSSIITTDTLTNLGQWRHDFMTVVAASAGYTRQVATI